MLTKAVCVCLEERRRRRRRKKKKLLGMVYIVSTGA
jgi:hypothetical protein